MSNTMDAQEYFAQQQAPHMILCCMCGTTIPANPSNMCVNCIRGQVDITEGIPKQLTIQWCRACNRYLQPPTHWVQADLESKELLTLCVKRIKGLNKLKLIDAGFVWTEPHSRRIKVKLTVQSEVFNGTILQQIFIIEYVVQSLQCDKCARREAKDTWNAVAQVRQKVEHKKTFFFLEQLILKHNAHSQVVGVKERADGLDFFFSHRSHCMKFVDFLQAVVPLRSKTSEQLISQDDSNNTFNYKYTYSVEIAPLCRDDLVCLPTKMAASLGYIGPLVLVTKISSLMHIIDPMTLAVQEISAQRYYERGEPFRAIAPQKQLVPYTVLDVTPLGVTRGKYMLAEVQVAREADFGYNDTTFTTRTHLGHLFKPGDSALGYDLANANFNDADLVSLKGKALPDVVLVRKVPLRSEQAKRRHWKLKRMTKEDDDAPVRRGDDEKESKEYDMFLQELEEDKDMRSRINMYREPNAEEILLKKKQEREAQNMLDEDDMGDEDEEGEVGLEELLDDIDINEDGDDNDV